jgi:hypothetical protein
MQEQASSGHAALTCANRTAFRSVAVRPLSAAERSVEPADSTNQSYMVLFAFSDLDISAGDPPSVLAAATYIHAQKAAVKKISERLRSMTRHGQARTFGFVSPDHSWQRMCIQR